MTAACSASARCGINTPSSRKKFAYRAHQKFGRLRMKPTSSLNGIAAGCWSLLILKTQCKRRKLCRVPDSTATRQRTCSQTPAAQQIQRPALKRIEHKALEQAAACSRPGNNALSRCYPLPAKARLKSSRTPEISSNNKIQPHTPCQSIADFFVATHTVSSIRQTNAITLLKIFPRLAEVAEIAG